MLGPKGVIFVGLYRKWFVIFSLLALTILSGCGKKLDTETLTMLENCDAACMGKVQTIGSQMVPIPEGTGLDCVETSDGMRLAMLLKIRLSEDFFGNLTPTGNSIVAYTLGV